MVHQSTKTKVFEKLIASLQSAPQGSRELDIIVAFLIGDTSTEAGQMIQLLVEEGYSWDIVSELLDQDLTAFTRSLEAPVPGENIVLALHSAKRGKWAAVHRTAAGNDVMAWAASEVLARRAAALKALRPDLRAPAAGPARPAPAQADARPVRPGPPRPDKAPAAQWHEPAAARPAEAHEEDAEQEWKILF